MLLDGLEHRAERLLPLKEFYQRLILFGFLSLGIILQSLALGILGYMSLEG